MARQEITYISNGVTQDERLPEALLPDNLKIDDRSTVDLVSFLGGYSSLLNYYKTDDAKSLVKDGDWSFFVNDPIFRLAEIATADPQRYREQLDLIFSVLQDPKSTLTDWVYALRLLFEIVTSLLDLTNKWLQYVNVLPDDFKEEFVSIVQNNLSSLLVTVRGCALFYEKHAHLTKYPYFEARRLKSFNETYWTGLHDYSGIEKTEAQLKQACDGSENPREIINNTYAYITTAAQNIQYNHNYIISLANSTFNKILAKKSDIKPDLALLIAFLKLFENAQQKINALTGKHLDFYYKDILKLSEAPLVPDTTYIVLQLVNGITAIQLNEGTAFDAGKDMAGNTVTFSTTKNTGLNQIQVADLRTLFVTSNPLIKPQITPTSPQHLITGVYSATHPVAALVGTSGFAVLGEDQVAFSDEQQTMQDATLGFACSSAAFFLSGGTRTITIELFFTENSFYENFILPLRGLTIPAEGTTAEFGVFDTVLNTESLFNEIFSDAFLVSATGAKGWFDLAVTNITYSENPWTISLEMVIQPETQAVTAYDPLAHGSGYTTPYPVISFMVKHAFPYYAYNFLNNLKLQKATIQVNVQELKNISLYNQYGQIDASKPFQPLGVQPEEGSYLLIGSNELFIKNLSEIDVSIDWQTLPSTGDFGTYYAAYNITPPVANNTFQVEVSFLKNNAWVSQSGLSASYDLFDSIVQASPKPPVPPLPTVTINETSTFKFTPLDSTIVCTSIDPAAVNKPLIYDQNTSGGFLKMELSAPSYGFGASLYNNVLSNVVLGNAMAQIEQLEPKKSGLVADIENALHITPTPPPAPTPTPVPLPNAPFTPIAADISVSYTAGDTIDFLPRTKTIPGFEPFYHIDAFSIYPVTAKATPPVAPSSPVLGAPELDRIGSYKYLLPQYSNQGTLYIGFSNVIAPESVNIFFQLSEKALEATVDQLPAITWSYLSSNVWKNFEKGNNIYDGTMGLIKSGVVVVDLPMDITDNNTIMPTGLFWIMAQATTDLEIFSNLTAIYTQVAEVTYSNPSTTQRSSLILPAGTITKPVNSIAQLKSVSQPFSSTGGMVVESQNAFYARVSERLRHKQRAIAQWDYERMVLQNFPQVYKTKCIDSSSLKRLNINPGNIELVVIPSISSEDGSVVHNKLGPVFGFTMLEEIKQYIQQYASPHVQVNVRNPVYEKLKVKCRVKFYDSSPFFLQKLNDDIRNFLSPWVLGNTDAYNIGAGVQKSTVLGYIQQLDYVEFVTGFSIVKISEANGHYHFHDTATKKNEAQDMLLAITPWSVFVSATQHLITAIDQIEYKNPTPVGIGELSIENDFIIQKSQHLFKAMADSTNSNLYYI